MVTVAVMMADWWTIAAAAARAGFATRRRASARSRLAGCAPGMKPVREVGREGHGGPGLDA
ncbi:hypothetical protein AB4144_34645, partial [Rhizobiaceae sp. 2RAB30]